MGKLLKENLFVYIINRPITVNDRHANMSGYQRPGSLGRNYLTFFIEYGVLKNKEWKGKDGADVMSVGTHSNL